MNDGQKLVSGAHDAAQTLEVSSTFINGVGPVRARNFGWHETLTVVRRDFAGYGVERYIVRDRYGRLGYAY